MRIIMHIKEYLLNQEGARLVTKVFIDGREGTTGLRIAQRLKGRQDIVLIAIDESQRKDPHTRKACLNQADIAVLCLPDDAAAQAVGMIENPSTRVLDASTAHRTLPGWAYGFAELSPAHESAIKAARYVAVPGCHATGFIALVYPLVAQGMLKSDACLNCHSVTGYSGGGKTMIAQYEQHPAGLLSPRQYGLSQTHKHIKEMTAVSGLDNSPVFSPMVSNFYSGMVVSLPLFAAQTGLTAKALGQFYRDYFKGQGLIQVLDEAEIQMLNGFLPADALAGKDMLEIIVTGNEQRMVASARFDNLGKGSSGAAVQCLNLMMGANPLTGLEC